MRLPILATIAMLAAPAVYADDVRTETVRFETGASSATITDSIKGYESVSYELGAAEGQSMAVDMSVDNLSAYFNIYGPGKGPGDEALYVGSTGGTRYQGTLPSTGTYTVNVYLFRNAARRDEVANYTLEIGIE